MSDLVRLNSWQLLAYITVQVFVLFYANKQWQLEVNLGNQQTR